MLAADHSMLSMPNDGCCWTYCPRKSCLSDVSRPRPGSVLNHDVAEQAGVCKTGISRVERSSALTVESPQTEAKEPSKLFHTIMRDCAVRRTN